METNTTTLIVAALGAGGLGAILREIFSGIAKLTRGVALKESGRKEDIVADRDRALTRADQAEAREEEQRQRAEREYNNRRRTEQQAAQMQYALNSNGLGHLIPNRPVIEETLTPVELKQIREETPDV